VQSVPIQIGIGEFGNHKGLLVTLDDSGKLNIGYLGTKPPVAAIGGVKRDLDYDKLDEEHRKLLQIIREVQTENKSEPTDHMTIRCQLGKTLDRVNHEDSLGMRLPDSVVRIHTGPPPPRTSRAFSHRISLGGGISDQLVKVTARVFIAYAGSTPANNVHVAINVPEFVYSVPATALFAQITGVKATPTIIDVVFLANSLYLPTTLDFSVTATYLTNSNEPRVATYQSTLPFSLCCKLRIPNKNAPYKLTLDTQHPPQSLVDLFSDIVQSTHDINGGNADLGDVFDSSGGAMALGFQFWCYSTNYQSDSTNLQQPANENKPSAIGILGAGNDATNAIQHSTGSIIVSKSGGRYRIQADSYPVLSLLTAELNKRLTIKLREVSSQRSESKDPNQQQQPPSAKFNLISFAENIPLENYFLIIGNHFKIRQLIQVYVSQLNDMAHQYRMIEKRLLARYKDRTPSSLNGLDVLSNETYQNIMFLTGVIQELHRQLNLYRIEVKATSRLVILLCYLKYELSPYEYSLLESYFSLDTLQIQSVHNIENTQEWEEIVESTLTYLLKTVLAKNAKETAVVTTSIEILDNVDKLTKHIAMVVDRLSKGGRLMKLKTSK
jgi:Bardet-Biedl syndrome 9 protein